MPTPEIYGLILAGGKSLRMGRDKSLMIYPQLSPLPQRQRLVNLLESNGHKTFISCRADQVLPTDNVASFILDNPDLHGGPAVGILSAHLFNPTVAWLVIACDFPWMDQATIKDLASQRKAYGISTGTQNAEQIIEPLFAIWEPETLETFLINFRNGLKSPQKTLMQLNASIAKMVNGKALLNINTLDQIEAHPELRSLQLQK